MHSLPDLGYSHDALEPYIDARTMEIHHGKHHQAYVNNLNNALDGHPDLADKTIEQLLREIESVPEAIRTAVRNNGGGHANHSLFWPSMSASGGGEPSGDLGSAIAGAFGSFEDFQARLAAAGGGQFGSGWGWLVMTSGGDLEVYSTPNQDSPHMKGDTPLLGIDVWEHAYYLNYQNRRPDYIKAWWNVVDWNVVAARYAGAKGG
jgi:Fe-Mn family superoxide dismutase